MELPGPSSESAWWEAGDPIAVASKLWELTRWAEGCVQSRHPWARGPAGLVEINVPDLPARPGLADANADAAPT
jgi:hypothetical protein